MSYRLFVRDGLEACAEKNPEWRDVYQRMLMLMQAGHISRPWLDVFMQSNRGYSLTDAAVYSHILNLIESKQLVIYLVPVGQGPYANDLIEENQRALDRILPPFTASFFGATGDIGDGFVSWADPVNFSIRTSGGEEFFADVSPASAVLEVGTTCSETTWWHLTTSRYLARWPYGSKIIWVLHWHGDAMNELLERILFRKGES